MDALIAAFLAWIVAKTGLAAHDPPRIVLLSQEKMLELTFGPNRRSGLTLEALHIHEDAVIYLPETWSAVDLREKSALLHELVHHMQRSNNVQAPCEAALEHQAYDLQFMWLREQGVENPYELVGINEFTIVLLSRCADPDTN